MQKQTTNRLPYCHQVRIIILFASLFALIFQGCTGLKYVPEGKKLYTGAKVDVVPEGRVGAKKRIKDLMGQNVTPDPNTTILGMRPGLWFVYIAGEPEKPKGLKHFIKNKLGQAPVYLSDVNPERTTNLIEGHLINAGFFHTRAEHEVITKKKTASVKYTAFVQAPYTLRNITYPKEDTLFQDIDSIKANSELAKGQRYNLDRLQSELDRIERSLENFGYFYFDDRHLIFEADSTVGERQVDLQLMLEEDVPRKATTVYKVGTVTVLPDYILTRDSLSRRPDTLMINGYYYVDRLGNYKPEIITKVINLKEGEIYRRIDREYTLSHLMSLGSFKFVDIEFRQDPIDSTKLNTKIYLTPYHKKSIRAELQATSKSNNFVGPGLEIRFTNRNFLGGSERFDVTVNTGYEVQISRTVGQPLNAFELGAESTLSIPRFVTPFEIYYPNRKFLPSTDIAVGFRLQQRVGFFRLNSFNTRYGFTWKENTLKSHEFFPVDINFMQLGKTSPEFDRLISRNPFLERSLENQFILGARYSYTLNTQIDEQRESQFTELEFKRSQFYLTSRIETSGNLAHLLRGGQFKSSTEQDSSFRIFGASYAQYVRGEIDFRHYFRFSETNQLASRINLGTGYAYGNSFTMPYIRQFSTGGSNSVRAFPARSIGPGTYDVREDQTTENSVLFLDQRGDIKFEANIEYRADITKVFKTAVFADAGNIWLWTEDQDRPGSEFKAENLFNELAVGTGVGLRLDFNFFLLRFDLAFPVRKPYRPNGERWVFNEIDLGNSDWRRENLILNIAIGYPF